MEVRLFGLRSGFFLYLIEVTTSVRIKIAVIFRTLLFLLLGLRLLICPEYLKYFSLRMPVMESAMEVALWL